ncbi:MAG TPA: thiamine pyrophosphate-dependent dehydrogenase E1 component subunit alpha [Bauldia sp.]|nr:thiamine pyrophosphate-dependent dehydrogenase E1 component subunit alpha [Bauldia sp.]
MKSDMETTRNGAVPGAAPGSDSGLPPPESLLAMHRTMVTIRVFEERVRVDYLARRMPGFTHSYVGEEAVATGGCAALEPGDLITSTHRGHGHAIAKGVGIGPMMAELYGKATGTCIGRGGSMHIADFSLGMLGANGIVGGGFGLAAGAALAAKFQKTPDITLCFFGDGAMNKGTFHEGLNFSGLHKLPVVFLCENNQFAQYTAVARNTAITDLAARAASYGMPGVTVDGNDVLAVWAATRAAADRARSGGGPSLIIADTYRFYGHNVGEAVPYRTKEEVEERRKGDPVARFEAWLAGNGYLDEEGRKRVWDAVGAEVEASVKFALESPDPDPATALDDLYADTRAAWSTL